MLGKQGHANADGDRQAFGTKHHRLGQFVEQAFGDFTCMGLGILAADQHCKLVATQARDGVTGTHMFTQALGNALQHHVASGVAVLVIDGLEVIQVDQQQGCGFMVGAGVGQCRFTALDQEATVVQFGQGVVKGGVLQGLFALFELCVGAGQFAGAQVNRVLQFIGAALDLSQASGFLAVSLLDRKSVV